MNVWAHCADDCWVVRAPVSSPAWCLVTVWTAPSISSSRYYQYQCHARHWFVPSRGVTPNTRDYVTAACNRPDINTVITIIMVHITLTSLHSQHNKPRLYFLLQILSVHAISECWGGYQSYCMAIMAILFTIRILGTCWAADCSLLMTGLRLQNAECSNTRL